MCFKSNDNYFKLITFDFDISGIDKNYATKGNQFKNIKTSK